MVDDAGTLVRSRWQRGTTASSDLGGGTPGTGGVPHFDGFCDQVAGQAVTFQLSDAAPKAPVVIVFGRSQGNFPFAGGVIVPAPDFLLPAVTDAAGELSLPITWPPGVGSAFTLYYQNAILDPAALQGIALSNAMAGTTPRTEPSTNKGRRRQATAGPEAPCRRGPSPLSSRRKHDRQETPRPTPRIQRRLPRLLQP